MNIDHFVTDCSQNGQLNHGKCSFGLFVEHDRTVFNSDYKLTSKLFEINEPFFMKTEKWCREHVDTDCNCDCIKDRKRKRVKSSYQDSIDVSTKAAIIQVVEKAKKLGLLSNGMIPSNCDNSAAEETAKLIHCHSCPNHLKVGIMSNMSVSPIVADGYIIPANTSFHVTDVVTGLDRLLELIKSNHDLIVDDHFTIVIDPPWASKSVKRKKNYVTQSMAEIEQMFSHLKPIIDTLSAIQEEKYQKVDIKICIWTTEKFKLLTENMMTELDSKLVSSLLWHKVTKYGHSAKVRGSSEYLTIGHHKLNSGQESDLIGDGVLVSVPSAIHSHKPPLDGSIFNNYSNRTTVQPPNERPTEPVLVKNKLPSPWSGIELYARYLRPGFHSIGLECIKLQVEELFE